MLLNPCFVDKPLKLTHQEFYLENYDGNLKYNAIFSVAYESFYDTNVYGLIQERIKGYKVVALVFDDMRLIVNVMMLRKEV